MKSQYSVETQRRKNSVRVNVVIFSAVILSGVLLVASGGFALSSKHKAIRREIIAQEEADIRVRDINHFLDEIPKCVSSCIFPRILQQGCAHTDTSCICQNLRSLDDYDDSPKPKKYELKRELMEEVEELEIRGVIVEPSEDPCVHNFGKREDSGENLIEVEDTDAVADISSPVQSDLVKEEDGFEIQITVENIEGKRGASDRPRPVVVELEEYALQNETEIEEQRHFKHCVEECSLLEQLRAPFFIANYCWGLGEPFEFPEVMVPMAEKRALSSLGSASATLRASTAFPALSTGTLVSASASGANPSRVTTSVGLTTLPGGSVSSLTKTVVVTEPATVTVSPTFTSTPTLEPSLGGLSTGAKIGLGVAIPLVVIFALAGLAFWWFRIRKKKQNPPVAETVEPYNGMPELGGGAFQEYKRSELGGDGTEIKKPEAVKYPTEMDATRTPAVPVFELPNNPSNQNLTPELGHRSPVARKPVNKVTPSGFQPPWNVGEQDGFMTPPMMANLGHGNGSVNSLALLEQPQSAASLQPQKALHSPQVSVYSTAPPYHSSSPVSPPTASNTLASSDDQELAQLEREMAAVRERKERLREVEALERREEELKRRISSLPGGGGGASPTSGASRVAGGLGGIEEAVEKTS